MNDANNLNVFFNSNPDLKLDSSATVFAHIKQSLDSLTLTEENGSKLWHEGDPAIPESLRVRLYPTGHSVFYHSSGRRFLMFDPEGTILHECAWKTEGGTVKLDRARIQLDSGQWVGILPENKTFSTDIDISNQPEWDRMSLDDLRRGASQVWKVPFAEIKYFYRDENFQEKGGGKYHIELKKDSMFALDRGEFGKMLFISFMLAVDWGRLDLIPVVELFQSALPGTGGAVFEFIWGLYEDQNRQSPLQPLRYRGLPTYPSRESFNIFSAFFTPKGPQAKELFEVFMDTNRSHEIEWIPKINPPWRFFSREHKITVTVQDGFLYKTTVWEDKEAMPYINCAKGAKPPCQREGKVSSEKLILLNGPNIVCEIPLDPRWGAKADNPPAPDQPKTPITWKNFFSDGIPSTDSAKMQFTVAFYPEGPAEIAEASVQPLALDQMIYYMEESPDMPDKLEKVENVLIHTLDAVIAGCVDSSHNREYTILYGDPEFAVKNAQLLWNHAASNNELENMKRVRFLNEADYVEQAYRQQYDLIFKWIPFMFFHDRENCEAMFLATLQALKPDGILFLTAPYPIKGLFKHYGLEMKMGDPIIDMPFFRQHLKICPENQINDIASVFLLEKK